MEPQVVPPGGDENSGPEQEAFNGLVMSIALVLVSLRFYVRARIMKKPWWDDFFLLLGMLFSIAGFGLTVAKVRSGYGRHVYYLSPNQISLAAELEAISTTVIRICVMFTKLSICLFLLRIFANNRIWKRALYIIIAVTVAINVSSATIVLVQCKPTAKLWNPTIQGTCWPQDTQITMAYYQGVVSIVTDFLLAFLPIYFLKDVQILLRTKLSICALMSLGVFTAICAINRTALLYLIRASDFTYASKRLDYWAMLEQNVMIIATAISALRPLWAKSANQNQKTSRKARRADDKQRLNSIYVSTDQQIRADSLPSRLETRITAQGGKNHGDVGSEATSLPDCNGIMKTNDISMKNFRKFEGKWIPEHSSLSDKERIVEDAV